MNVLSKLVSMNDTDIQRWLRKVGYGNVRALGAALVGADETVRDCVMRNMSDKAKTVLSEDIEKNKANGLSEKEILSNASTLEKML